MEIELNPTPTLKYLGRVYTCICNQKLGPFVQDVLLYQSCRFGLLPARLHFLYVMTLAAFDLCYVNSSQKLN